MWKVLDLTVHDIESLFLDELLGSLVPFQNKTIGFFCYEKS